MKTAEAIATPTTEPRVIASRVIAGRYRLGALIGEGGMGAVYQAEHLGLQAQVAIKLLAEGGIADRKVLGRFRREARAMGSLRHENVISVLDAGTEEDGTPFLVMELLEGESLSAKIRRARFFGTDVACWAGVQVLAGLGAAHAKGVVHRDLKAGNVFVARQSEGGHRIKLLDFGVSKLVGSSTYNVTAQGAVVGTPCCMAPEQLTGEVDSDPRIDLYAAGVLLYRLVTGRLPYKGNSADQIFEQIVRRVAPRPRSLNPNCSPRLEALILRAMAPRPEDRFEDAASMRAALLECGSSPDPTAMVTPVPLAVGDEKQAPPSPMERCRAPAPRPQARATPERPRPAPALPTPPVSGKPPRRAGQGLTGPTEAASPAARRGIRRPSRRRRARLAVSLALLGAGLCAVLAFLGVSELRGAKAGAEAMAPLRFGVARYMPAELVKETRQPVAEYLSDRLGRPVELVIAEDERELAQRLVSGDLHMAALSPYTYVKTRRRVPEMALLATPVMAGGASSYEGSILTRADSDVQTLADLEGRVFCYVRPDSTSGYIYPRAVLRRAGMDPDSAFAATVFGGDHLTTLRELERGTCDGAAVYTDAWLDSGDDGLTPGSFRVLAETPRIPLDAYVAAPGLAEGVAGEVQRALVGIEPGSEAARRFLGGDRGIAGFAPARDGDYDSVRDIIAFIND